MAHLGFSIYSEHRLRRWFPLESKHRMDIPQPPLKRRILAWVPFVTSAAIVALAIKMTLEDPIQGAILAGLAVVLYLPRWLGRRRVRQVLESGDVEAVLTAWSATLDRLPHRDTLGPLLVATALSANGFVERARRAITRARRGDAWEAAREQRLLVEALLDAYEGDRTIAIAKAEELQTMPLPPTGPFARARIQVLREAIVALTRAFARRPERGDLSQLKRAARNNPLMAWPMRYAAAIVHVDGGEPDAALALIEGAPAWPEESVFSQFHAELLAQTQRA